MSSGNLPPYDLFSNTIFKDCRSDTPSVKSKRSLGFFVEVKLGDGERRGRKSRGRAFSEHFSNENPSHKALGSKPTKQQGAQAIS